MKITMHESRLDRIVGRVRDVLAGVGLLACVLGTVLFVARHVK